MAPSPSEKAGQQSGMTASTRDDPSVRSVRRALSILRAFGPGERALPLGEIARRAEIDKATALRLLRTLIREHLVEQQPSRDYSLSLGVLSLSAGATPADELRRRAQPMLAALAEMTEATAFLAVVHGGEALCIEALSGELAGPTLVTVGLHVPLHACAAPRVLMAFLPLEARMAMLAAPLPALTPATPTDPYQVSAMLDTIRTRGWDNSHSEIEDGVSCLGLPLRDDAGEVIATVGIAARHPPDPDGEQPRHLETVIGKVREFERRYGRERETKAYTRRGGGRVPEGRPRTF
jgi:IclR family pca regulon transcriptional regulator